MATRILLILVMVLAPRFAAADDDLGPAIEREIAKIDARTTNPDQKMITVEALARRLGTHRNRLLLLRRQTKQSYGRIFVSQLEAAGHNRQQILAELRAVNQEVRNAGVGYQLAGEGGSATPPARPIVYVQTGVDHNATGTFFTVLPEIGVSAEHLRLVAGVPYYRNWGTDLSAGGIGDVYVSGLVYTRAGRNDIGANLVAGFPTGDSAKGLGAGKVTLDASALYQRNFEWFRPFAKAGVANSIFNNVGYQRPYISTGNAAHLSGGIDFRVHRSVIVGVGGFALRPWGDQTVHSRWSMGMPADGNPPGSMPGHPPGGGGPGMGSPGMGGGMSSPLMPTGTIHAQNTPFHMDGQSGEVPAEDLRDHGASAWVTVTLRPGLTLSFQAARSIPFELTTVSVGLGFDLGRLFFPGKHF